MYVQPSFRYRAGHVIGDAEDKPGAAARTILAIMIKPFYGAPSVILRLVPVHSLSPAFLHHQICSVINLIEECNGFVVSVISDNHPTNRSCYSLLNSNINVSEKWCGKETTGLLLLAAALPRAAGAGATIMKTTADN